VSSPLRLLVLADGNSIHTEHWLRGLAASGPVELRLVTMNPAGVRDGIRNIAAVVSIDECNSGPVKPGGGNWRYLLNVPAVWAITRRTKPDAIIAIYLSSYGLIGAIAKGPSALVHVMLGSDLMVTPSRSAIHRLLTRSTLRRGDLFVSSSMTMTARLQGLARIRQNSVLTQQYGLDDWVLDYPRAPKAYGFVSNRAWVANSRIQNLLRIFGRLKAPGTLALVGGGGPLEAEILRQATVDPRVVPLGPLSYRENINVVAQSTFYLSMTESDGASVSLMEAMAVGAIPIVSDIEPNREWVQQGTNGLLVPLDDEAAAVASIERLLAQPEDALHAMRLRNKAIVRERGSLTSNMTTFRKGLSELLESRAGTRS
jgi:glycosyltransferase involved in cell wall biosynthesis